MLNTNQSIFLNVSESCLIHKGFEELTLIFIITFRIKKPKSTLLPKKKIQQKGSSGWLKMFPISAMALAIFLGLLYLFAPDILYKMLGFSIRISPELNYVNGAPPM